MTFQDFLAANAARFEEIKHLSDRIRLNGSSYARASYVVTLDAETRQLSDKDLIILCDRGNACFGGHVGIRSGDSIAVDVYTD